MKELFELISIHPWVSLLLLIVFINISSNITDIIINITNNIAEAIKHFKK